MKVEERIKKKVEITESSIEGRLEDVLSLIKTQRRSGHLIISFNYGTEVGKKFERVEKSS